MPQTKTDNPEIVLMWDSGLDVGAIADELSISPQTVRAALNIAHRDLRRPKVHKDEPLILADYANNNPASDILKKYNISYSQLYTILGRHDVPLRKHTGREALSARLDRAIEMYQANAPLWEIKQETGVHQPVLHAELHARNVPLRRPRKA